MTQTFSKFTEQKNHNELVQVVTIYKASDLTRELVTDCLIADAMFSIEQLYSMSAVIEEIAVLAEYFDISVTYIKESSHYHIDCYMYKNSSEE